MFRFEDLVGQETPVRALRRAIARGTLAHAILLHGESGLGLERAALALARAALCERNDGDPCEECGGCRKSGRLDHADLRVVLPLPATPAGREDDDPAEHHGKALLEAMDVFRENPWRAPEVSGARQILVGQARHLKKWAQLKSYEGGRRVAVVWQADRMGVQAQNALLKLLEEPPDQLLLVLASDAPEKLLPTILSRCQALRLRPAPEEELAGRLERSEDLRGFFAASGLDARQLARLAGGNPGRALEIAETLAEDPKESKELAAWERARAQGDEAAPRPPAPLWDASLFLRDALGRPQDLHARVVALEGARDRTRLARLFAELQDWLQDADLLRALPGPEGEARVRNAHQLESLKRFAEGFSCERPDELAAELETARRLCERNVSAFGLLVTLAQELRARLQKTVRQTA